jgi:predicted nucleic acid-binding protein
MLQNKRLFMKRVIFLDTNVFESAKFSYDSHRMEKFLETSEEKGINLYITDVIKYEVIKRIKTNIQNAIEKIDKHNLEILVQSLEVENKEKLKLINDLSEKLIQDFENFLTDYNINVILSNFDQSALIDFYFNNKAPFSEQKKHEFPDAIIILTIDKWSAENNKIPLIVTNDKGMSSYETENDIKFFNKISDITNLLLTEKPENDLLDIYKGQLEKIKDKIIDDIKSYKDNFTLYSYDHIDDIEVDNVKIENVTLNKTDIININTDDNIIQLEVDFKIEFSLNASYPDMDTMSRDKEDGVNYFYQHINSELNLKENTTCYLDIIIYKEDDDFDLDNFEIEDKEFEFNLDENNITNIEYSDDFSSCKW